MTDNICPLIIKHAKHLKSTNLHDLLLLDRTHLFRSRRLLEDCSGLSNRLGPLAQLLPVLSLSDWVKICPSWVVGCSSLYSFSLINLVSHRPAAEFLRLSVVVAFRIVACLYRLHVC